MHSITYILVLILFKICLSGTTNIDKTELIFGFMVHRHGDRAPIKLTLPYISNSEKVIELTTKYGYGQLTDVGKTRAYKIGKFIRRRYGELVSAHYNKSEMYIRSTDSTRTKMTVLAAMAAVYPPGPDNWSRDVNWTPVPYTTMPVEYDDLLAVLNCPIYVREFKQKLETPVPGSDKYQYIVEELSDILNMSISKNKSTYFYFMNDAFLSQNSLGVPVHPKIEKLMTNITKAAGDDLEYLYGDKENFGLQTGVLLREFFSEVEKILSGKSVPKVRVYSAHDITVYQFASILRITPPIGVPLYGAVLSLELRRDHEKGKYIVLPVYLKEPDATEEYLNIDGCEVPCELDTFRHLTYKYTLNRKQWRERCEYKDDSEIDSSTID